MVSQALSPRSFDPTEFPKLPKSAPLNMQTESLGEYIERIDSESREYKIQVETWVQRMRRIDEVQTFGEWIKGVDPECEIRSVETLLGMWHKRVLEICQSLEE